MLIKVKKSEIHGVGLFSVKTYKPKEKIYPVFALDKEINKYLPIKCSIYVNHKNESNCDVVLIDDVIWMVAKETIKPNTELTSNYRDLKTLNVDLTHLNIDYDLE
jgi:hypothetical protein